MTCVRCGEEAQQGSNYCSPCSPLRANRQSTFDAMCEMYRDQLPWWRWWLWATEVNAISNAAWHVNFAATYRTHPGGEGE